jgi:hypothetical protein
MKKVILVDVYTWNVPKYSFDLRIYLLLYDLMHTLFFTDISRNFFCFLAESNKLINISSVDLTITMLYVTIVIASTFLCIFLKDC